MQRKHYKTLEALFQRPVLSNIRWKDIEALLIAMGAEIQEREGSRIAVVLFEQVKVFHRPHPQPTTDKGAVASAHQWLQQNGIHPEHFRHH